MFVKRERYDVLVRAEERAEMLRIRVNQLEHENADLRFAVSGRPQRALQLDKPGGSLALGRGNSNKPAGAQVIESVEDGLAIFQDIGDEGSIAEGIRTGSDGRLAI